MKKYFLLHGAYLGRLAKRFLALVAVAALGGLVVAADAYDARQQQTLADENNYCLMETVLATVQLNTLLQGLSADNTGEIRQALSLRIASNVFLLDSRLESADPATRAAV